MRPISDAFKLALTRSHQLVVRADLLVNRVPQNLPLEIVTGSVTLDRTSDVRGRCDLTIKAEGLIPTDAFSPITPFGAELQIWRGIRLASGDELVSLGIFGIQDVQVDDLGGTISISGLDRAQAVKDADFETTHVTRKGVNYADEIKAIVNFGVPGLTYLFDSTPLLTPFLTFSDGRWDAAQQMATSIGWDLYFNGDGAVVGRPVPDPSSTPVFDLKDGAEGVLVSAGKTWSRDSSYNRVIASSSDASDAAPVVAVATDNDPTSPTYYDGPFGHKPLKYSAPFVGITQAQNAANGLLRKSIGVAQSLDLTVVPNPALEPGDVISVRTLRIGINEVDVLDSVTIGLDAAGPMTASARVRQIIT